MMFKLPAQEEGQGLVEYALILVLIAIVVIAILLQLGPSVRQVYCQVASTLQTGSCGVITSYNVKINPGGHLQIKDVVVSQATNVTVTVKDNTYGDRVPQTEFCNTTCDFSFGGDKVASGSGVITSDHGDYIAFSYAK